MKKILILLFFGVLIFNSAKNVFAITNISCNGSSCVPAITGSIFSSQLWWPLKSETHQVAVQNTSVSQLLIGLSVLNGTTGLADLSNVMTMRIDDTFNVLYDDPLTNFYTLNEFPLTYLGSGAAVTYNFTATLDDVDNDWQNRSTSFEMDLGFLLLPTPTSTSAPTNTPIPGPTNTPQPGPTNTPGPGPTNTPAPGPTATPVLGTGGGYITYEYGSEIIDVPVLGLATTGTPSPKPTKIISPAVSGTATGKAKGAGVCVDPWWWWAVILVQVLLHSVLRQIGHSNARRQIFFWFILSELIFGLILWKFFCTITYLIISILIFFIYSYLIHLKTKALEEETGGDKEV